MTVDDLMTLFALFTLTVQYHEHHQDDYHINAQQTPPNKTPLYITDILSMRGKKKTVALRETRSGKVSIVLNLPTFNYMNLPDVG